MFRGGTFCFSQWPRRIESGELTNPGIRYLANVARVLGVEPSEDISWICKPEWLRRQIFHEDGPQDEPDIEHNPGKFVDPDDY